MTPYPPVADVIEVCHLCYRKLGCMGRNLSVPIFFVNLCFSLSIEPGRPMIGTNVLHLSPYQFIALMAHGECPCTLIINHECTPHVLYIFSCNFYLEEVGFELMAARWNLLLYLLSHPAVLLVIIY